MEFTSRMTCCLAIAFVVSASVAHAQSSIGTADLDGPRLKLDKTRIDLGPRIYDEELKVTFTAANVGTESLSLNITKTSCGCTSTLVTKGSLAPGDQTEITLTHLPKAAKKRLGNASYDAVLETNDKTAPAVMLSFTVRHVEQVFVTPEIIVFGEVPPNTESITREFSIECLNDSGTSKVVSVDVASPYLAVKKTGEQQFSGHSVHTYSLDFDPSKCGNDRTSSVTILTDSRRVPVIEIPVKFMRAYPMLANPKALLLGVLREGSTTTRTIRLVPQSKVEPAVKAICSDARIQTTLKASTGGNELTLEIVVRTDSGSSSKFDTEISVLGKDGEEQCRIPVKGVISPAAS